MYLGTFYEFEHGIDFAVRNRIHWFRPIAFIWFHDFSVLPSAVLAALIACRHGFPRTRIITWVLASLSLFTLGVGAYTVWHRLACIECFT
jgi:hypothetical protein